MDRTVEDLLRECAPQVLGTVARRFGDFAQAGDAVQEALLAAARHWLERMTGNPVVSLNRAIAAAIVHGPAAGLELVDALADRLPGHYRVDAVRAHLHEMFGDVPRPWRTTARPPPAPPASPSSAT